MEDFKGKMYTVYSGNLNRVGWEFDETIKQGVLRVEFKRGDIYDHFPVSKEMFNQMWKAESKGKWFISEIKNNKLINFEKVESNE